MKPIVIIGGGILGLTVAYWLRSKKSSRPIKIIDKESRIGSHGSGRNSGVLHAGFYYPGDSLKAKFCIEGNQMMRAFCQEHGLELRSCGKLVVASNKQEIKRLEALEKRGRDNGVRVSLVSAKQAEKIEPNIRTTDVALWSPDTASVVPTEVCQTLKDVLTAKDVDVRLGTRYLSPTKGGILTSVGKIDTDYVINCAGLYSQKIARDFGFADQYSTLPVKGLYLKAAPGYHPVQTNVYPVPCATNPFLGVHFTVTGQGEIKIGPTAIPALWFEHYGGLQNFKIKELMATLKLEVKLWMKNAFGFRGLAYEEIKKNFKPYMISQSARLVKKLDSRAFNAQTNPGIRPQLVHKSTLDLVQDFIIDHDDHSLHVLNAVSPGFTASFSFSRYIVDTYLA